MRNRAEGAREFREYEPPKHPELSDKDRELFEKLVEYCDEIREKEPDWQKRVVYALEKFKADDYLTGKKRTRFYRLLAAEHGRRSRLTQQRASRESNVIRLSEKSSKESGSVFTRDQIDRMVADARRREVQDQIRSGELDPEHDRPTRPRRPHPDHP